MEQGARQFGWLGLGRIPAQFDLRALGWDLLPLPADLSSAAYPFLLDDLTRAIAIRSHLVRTRVIVADVADSATRAHLLALRFGEVVPPGLALEELAERTRRLSATRDALPRQRSHGPILLDLLHREGWVAAAAWAFILGNSHCSGDWRIRRTCQSPPPRCSATSGIWPIVPRPTAWRCMSAA